MFKISNLNIMLYTNILLKYTKWNLCKFNDTISIYKKKKKRKKKNIFTHSYTFFYCQLIQKLLLVLDKPSP